MAENMDFFDDSDFWKFDFDICKNEKSVSGFIDILTFEDVKKGEEFCTELLKVNSDKFSDRHASAALSRCLCRFLLHKKCKNAFLTVLHDNKTIKTAFFGQLNTYKYSIVWALKRIVRLGDDEFTSECIELLKNNMYRDDTAKEYESRWSLMFIIDEVLSAPEDYLNLTDSQREILEKGRNS